MGNKTSVYLTDDMGRKLTDIAPEAGISAGVRACMFRYAAMIKEHIPKDVTLDEWILIGEALAKPPNCDYMETDPATNGWAMVADYSDQGYQLGLRIWKMSMSEQYAVWDIGRKLSRMLRSKATTQEKRDMVAKTIEMAKI